MQTTLTVHGTHCQSCKFLIEDVCSEMPGVTSCTVDVPSGKMVVEHDGSLDLETLKKEIECLGDYTVTTE